MRKILVSAFVFAAVFFSERLQAQQLDSLPIIIGRTIPVEGAYIYPLQQRDSILIGDQIVYGFVLEDVGNEAYLDVPMLDGDPRGGIEVVSDWKIDTINVRDSKDGGFKKYDLKGEMVLTSFDEGVFQLPPLPILRLSRDLVLDTLLMNAVPPLEIKSIPVDTATFKPIGLHDQVRYPLTTEEIIRLVYCFHVAVILLLLLVFGLYLLMSRGREVQVRKKSTEPSHVVVMRILNKYVDSSLWGPESQKKSYSAITDAMRLYIEDIYGINATEMTTAEIFKDKTICRLSLDKTKSLQSMFEVADLVKFAKYTASAEETAVAVPVAMDFLKWSQGEIEKAKQSEQSVECVNTEK